MALVNELKVVYAAMGIECIWEVIEAAKPNRLGSCQVIPEIRSWTIASRSIH